jgi:hypothetical protein
MGSSPARSTVKQDEEEEVLVDVSSSSPIARMPPRDIDDNDDTPSIVTASQTSVADALTHSQQSTEMTPRHDRRQQASATVTTTTLTIRDSDGIEFVGTLQEGTSQKGRGIFTRLHPTSGKVISYNGEFENGYMNGHGVSTDDESGVVYEGSFCRGAAHGYGVCKWSQGWEYKGELLQRIVCTTVCLPRTLCSCLPQLHQKGEWRHDKRHGYGICRQLTEGGEVYTGTP